MSEDPGAGGHPFNPDAKRLLLLLAYSVVFLALLLPASKDPAIVWGTLWATLVPLWFGPLALLSPQCDRRWYDPAMLFNTMMFYYAIKGATLAFDTSIAYVAGMRYEEIRSAYLFAALNVVLGMLAWNLGFNWVLRHVSVSLKGPGPRAAGALASKWFRRPEFLLTVVGAACFGMFFQSTGQSILGFLVNPLLRSYLTDGTLGVQAPLANFWKLGAYLWPLGSLVWAARLGWVNAKRPGMLWLHLVIGTAIYFLIGGRIDTLGFLFGLLVIFNLLVRATPGWLFAAGGGAAFLYAYLTDIWRELWGREANADFGARLEALGNMQHSMKGLTDLLAGQSLADIRLLVRITDVYGSQRGLEWGETLTRVVTQFVPRSIWPNKPLDLSVVVNSLYDWREGMAGTPPGFLGEMFMNFHLPGVVLGCLVLGAAFAVLYCRWGLSARGPFDIVKYALIAPVAAILPSATFANVVSGAGVPILALVFLERWYGAGGHKSLESR